MGPPSEIEKAKSDITDATAVVRFEYETLKENRSKDITRKSLLVSTALLAVGAIFGLALIRSNFQLKKAEDRVQWLNDILRNRSTFVRVYRSLFRKASDKLLIPEAVACIKSWLDKPDSTYFSAYERERLCRIIRHDLGAEEFWQLYSAIGLDAGLLTRAEVIIDDGLLEEIFSLQLTSTDVS